MGSEMCIRDRLGAIYFLFAIFAHAFAPWCNGNTPDFGSDIPGSSPGGATNTIF